MTLTTERQDTLQDLLQQQGFFVELQDEVGLSFMFEGAAFFIPQSDDDPDFYQLLFPYFWSIESQDELERALLAADTVNASGKIVKIHTLDGSVWASIEALHESPRAFVHFIKTYLAFLQDALRFFRDAMNAEP